MKHRWLRQDGYSVGPANWRDLDKIREFDLLRLPGVDSHRIIKKASDHELVRELGDLEDTLSDPLALAVRGVVTSIARSLNLMSSGIEKILQTSKTRDPDAELISEIDTLISLASARLASADLVRTLHSLRASVGVLWDASHDCTLDWARAQLQDRGN